MARRTLSQEVKNGILSDLAAGVSPVTIAGKFGVSIPTVYNYRKNAVAAVAPETVTTDSSAATTGTAVLSTRKARKSR
jgi:hypothetical protein